LAKTISTECEVVNSERAEATNILKATLKESIYPPNFNDDTPHDQVEQKNNGVHGTVLPGSVDFSATAKR
jgi:hypothetical protein